MPRRVWLFLAVSVLVATPVVWTRSGADAPPEFNVKEHYTKFEYRIAMRDGKHLFTAIYVPKDSSHSYPFLLNRTPYSVRPYGVDHYRKTLGPSEEFDRAGYIFVFQDVRGRNMSEGEFIEMRPHIDVKKSIADVDDSSDTYDTLEWLLKNIPNNNGKAGIWGISYPGFFTSASIIDSHPALKAASPQAPMTDLFMGDDAYHGGAFMLAANFSFYTFFRPQKVPVAVPSSYRPFDYGTEDGYEFFFNAGTLSRIDALYFKEPNPLWEDQKTHDTYDDYWKARNLAPHLKNIRCPVLTVGGWFDAEDLAGPFKVYSAVKKYNPGTFSGLVEGPWVHGGWSRYDGNHLGSVGFASNTAQFYRTQVIFPFFEHHLKGKSEAELPEAYAFETGTNVWRQYPAWPPKQAQSRTLYFGPNGSLSFEPPDSPADAFDSYESDPAKPVPFIGYAATAVPQEYMVADQRFAASRTDVLVYRTEPLERDLTIAGPVSPHLFVSTTGTDSDFVVKLIDVYPPDFAEPESQNPNRPNDVPPPSIQLSGFQQLVRGEPMRGKFRKSFEKPEPLTPGKVEEVDFEMPDINHTFRRGHRIMVQVQSSWFPLIDLNPQTFVNIPDAKPEDFRKATERIYRGKGQSSGVVVSVLP